MMLLHNGRLISRDPERPYIERGAATWEGDTLLAVGDEAELLARYPDAERIDARGGVIMPGLINAHGHLYSSFARGMSVNGYAPRGFLDILDGLWWTLDRRLTNRDTRLSADWTFLDCIRNGVTTMFDHHASYGQIPGSLFAIAESAAKSGVRACLCYEVSDRDGPDKCAEAIRENVEFIRYARERRSPLLAGMFGLHASFTLSDDTLARCAADAPDGAGFHVHVAEGIEDVYDSLRRCGKRPVFRLLDAGVLRPGTICGHCTHVAPDEMDALAQADCAVVHNPESNMGNAIGCPPVLELLRRGVTVGLGTDGYTDDMLESYKVANLLHKHALHDATAAWSEMPHMLFENNAALASRAFGVELGKLKPGAAADVIVMDYDPQTPMDASNANGHILFGMSGRQTRTTIIAGKPRMVDYALTDLDAPATYAACREAAAGVWSRINA